MNQEGQTMKKTFKKLTALFATAALAFGLSACNDKEQTKETKQASVIEQIKSLYGFDSAELLEYVYQIQKRRK